MACQTLINEYFVLIENAGDEYRPMRMGQTGDVAVKKLWVQMVSLIVFLIIYDTISSNIENFFFFLID